MLTVVNASGSTPEILKLYREMGIGEAFLIRPPEGVTMPILANRIRCGAWVYAAKAGKRFRTRTVLYEGTPCLEFKRVD